MADIEEIFKGAIGLIFLVIFTGALLDALGQSIISGFSSFLIGIAFLAIILAVLLKILETFGGKI